MVPREAGVQEERRATREGSGGSHLGLGGPRSTNGSGSESGSGTTSGGEPQGFWERVKLRGLSGWLASTRSCESGTSGSYRADTGDGFYGLSVRLGLVGRGRRLGNPADAPAREQDYRAVIWRGLAGTGAWPNCGCCGARSGRRRPSWPSPRPDPAYGEASEAPPAVQDAAAASVPYDAWPNC